MSETIETTSTEAIAEDAQTDATAAEVTQPDPAEIETADDDSKPGREAAKYRRQLREAEAERDELRTQLGALRRAEVDRLVTDAKLKPAAVWAAGTELGNLLAADGTVDPAKVAAAVAATRETLGISPVPAAPSAHGQGKVGEPVGMGAGQGWQDAFAPRS